MKMTSEVDDARQFLRGGQVNLKQSKEVEKKKEQIEYYEEEDDDKEKKEGPSIEVVQEQLEQSQIFTEEKVEQKEAPKEQPKRIREEIKVQIDETSEFYKDS